MPDLNKYNVETVLRAIRLCMKRNDYTMDEATTKLRDLFGDELISEALRNWDAPA